MSKPFFAGEYDIIDTLNRSENTSVLLVRHKTLGSLRVMKLIKRQEEKGKLLFEASLLDKLRHPGIPVLYDYGETEDYVFLIEEYVNGEPLNEYLLSHTLTETQIIRYTIALSDILIYLHTGCTPAILYQDMKPEHIFIQGDNLKLVDYGISRFLSGSDKRQQKSDVYGTKSYASPEQIAGTPADERSDIYGLSRVVKEMSAHSEKKVSRQFMRLLMPALSEDPEKRPESVKEWRNHWLSLQKQQERFKNTEDHLCATISVVGNEHGVGTTHIAISLCTYLNRKNFGSALYEDLSGGNTVYKIARNSPAFLKQGDFIYHNGFRGFAPDRNAPDSFTHGEPYGLTVRDCGTDYSLSDCSDLVIVVGGGALWNIKSPPKTERVFKNIVYVINNSKPLPAINLSRRINRPVFIFPADSDAFSLTGKKKGLFDRILTEGGLKCTGSR